jgi:hypothetical protein
VPVAAITAPSKLYNRRKPLRKDDRIIRRLASSGPDISTATLIDLISSQETHERGKPLSEEAVRRVYQSYANAEGKLFFEYILKLAESNGMNDKMAKLMVKK